MNKSTLVLAAALAALSGLPLQAAPETFKIDPVHSTIGFKVKHLFSNVTGRFQKVDGTIVYDAEHPESSSVEATIPVTSIDTANGMRDKHLQSPDFFDVAQFAAMTFKSKSVKAADPKSLEVTGDLTLHGVTKEVVLNVDFLGKGAGPQGGQVSGWEATTKINREDFGLKWNKVVEGVAMVGDEVDIDLQIEADGK
ncbi:MAG: YceI family protein [Chthoniobacteraceae bacterium]